MSQDKSRTRNRLKLKDFKLDALLGITHAINGKLPVDELLQRYRKVLESELGIEKLVLYSHDGSWKSILQFGVKGTAPVINDEERFAVSGSFSLTTRGKKESFDVVIPVLNEGEAIAFVLVGDLEENKRGTSPVIKHMKFIQTITNIILVAIHNQRLELENLRQEGVRKELELAAEMQSMLVPRQLPSNEQYDVSAMYKPHNQVGGDYYDFFELPDGRMLLCMADVSGKGVSAAFLMSNFQASLMALFKYLNPDLIEAIHRLNDRVMFSAMGEKYITMFIAIFDPKNYELRYVNCGHNPPVLVHPSGTAELLTSGSIGLGMFEEIPRIQEGRMTIDPGSVLICYTDGLVEQENESQDEFGVERLAELGRTASGREAESLNALILEAFNAFRGSTPYFDDTALLTCRFL